LLPVFFFKKKFSIENKIAFLKTPVVFRLFSKDIFCNILSKKLNVTHYKAFPVRKVFKNQKKFSAENFF